MTMNLPSWDPCCGVSLKRGTKLIALIDMVTSVATACFVALALFITLFYGTEIQAALDRDKAEFPNEAEMYDYLGSGLMVTVLLLTLLTSILYFLLAQHLLHGAQQKDVTKLTRWFHVTTALLFVRIIFNTIAILASETSMMPIFGVLNLIYTGYSLWVVHLFRQELMTEECYTLRDHPTVYKL